VTTSSLETTTKVSTGLFNSGSTASRLFTMGRSLSVGLGLLAKIIQNVRFLDIDYPEETLEAFKTYGTDLFELPIPQAFYGSPGTKELHSQYARYDMEPSFLENYWDTIMMMLICLGCFFVIRFVQFLTRTQRKDHIVQVALKNIGQTFANYFIVQIYSNLDDVTFYLFLDIQSTKLSSPSAGINLAAGILFLLLGLALVFFHCWLLGKYQQAKSQGNLERFEAKYRILGTLYEDFKDNSIAKQSFFGILILRCVILVLVITLLQLSLVQAILMMLTNLVFLAYFIYHRPFKSLFDELTQYFCELTIFAAYLSVLILSVLDVNTAEESSLRNGLGKCIVIAGIVLALGGFIVQVIQLIGVIIGIYKFLKGYNRKKLKVKVSPSPTIDLSQHQQNSGTRVSENSSILRPSGLDQLELMSTSVKIGRRPSQNVPFARSDVRGLTMNHDNISILNQRRTRPNREDSERAQRNELFSGPLGSQISREPHQERQLNLNFGPSGEQRRVGNDAGFPTQMNSNSEARRRKIKRPPRERRNLHFSSFDEDII